MDLNHKIIDGVKQFPYLHDNNDNWEERNEAWMQLAEKLEIPEQILKVRWHSLLQGYQRDANFKYANKMDFVHRNPERTTKEIWPEFVINEDDIKYDNSEEVEQFVFLDENEVNINTKSLKENSTENNTCQEEINSHIAKVSNKLLKDKGHEKSDEKDVIKDGKTCILYTTQGEDEVEVSNNKSRERVVVDVKTSSMEQQMAAVDVNKKMVAKEVIVEKPQPSMPERCEDVIFGELVSAMLKRMDEDKKKRIKRDIMNILFS